MISITEMDGNYSVFQLALREVSNTLHIPIIVILIAMIVFSVFCIGWIIAEAASERSHMRYSLPRLLDTLKSGRETPAACIEKSGLLRRQKEALLELTKHPDFDEEMLRSLADNLLGQEHSHYDGILKLTGLISKLAPMAGLLGTLIPLGPGVIALGRGGTYTLSSSLLTAFDTTIAGLLSAGICLVIHTIRGRWYAAYMRDLETLMDCVAEQVSHEK